MSQKIKTQLKLKGDSQSLVPTRMISVPFWPQDFPLNGLVAVSHRVGAEVTVRYPPTPSGTI